jgi:hypothetical protein
MAMGTNFSHPSPFQATAIQAQINRHHPLLHPEWIREWLSRHRHTSKAKVALALAMAHLRNRRGLLHIMGDTILHCMPSRQSRRSQRRSDHLHLPMDTGADTDTDTDMDRQHQVRRPAIPRRLRQDRSLPTSRVKHTTSHLRHYLRQRTDKDKCLVHLRSTHHNPCSLLRPGPRTSLMMTTTSPLRHTQTSTRTRIRTSINKHMLMVVLPLPPLDLPTPSSSPCTPVYTTSSPPSSPRSNLPSPSTPSGCVHTRRICSTARPQ